MEEMIKRIIDMDRKAQEITEAARREKLESEKELFKRAEALKEEYLLSLAPYLTDPEFLFCQAVTVCG